VVDPVAAVPPDRGKRSRSSASSLSASMSAHLNSAFFARAAVVDTTPTLMPRLLATWRTVRPSCHRSRRTSRVLLIGSRSVAILGSPSRPSVAEPTARVTPSAGCPGHVFTMRRSERSRRPDPSVHAARSRCSRCPDLRVHDAAIPVFTMGRFPQSDGQNLRRGRKIISRHFASKRLLCRRRYRLVRSFPGQRFPATKHRLRSSGGLLGRRDRKLC
jgi:hypothetical protein